MEISVDELKQLIEEYGGKDNTDDDEGDRETCCCYGQKHDWVAVWQTKGGRWLRTYYDTEEQAKKTWGSDGVVPPNGCVFRYRY